MKPNYKTREEWLNAAADLLRPEFQKRAGIKLPKNIRIACGWTSAGRRGKRIGECWSRTSSADDTFEMFISPVLAEPVRVLGVTVHELTHAGVGLEAGHRHPFRKAAKAMLLEGKMKATTEGQPFKDAFAPILAKLGLYPHGVLSPGGSKGPKKQDARMLKCSCSGCGYIVRTTAKWLEVATPTCPDEACDNHGEAMDIE